MKVPEKEIETNKFKQNTTQLFKNESAKDAKDIDEAGLVSKIRAIDPQMTFVVICYSEINDLRFLLEGAGLFAEMRINRDLNILSKGHFLTMNPVQKEFIQTMVHEDNVEKDVIVTGPVGSGKTILGLEAINIKKSHYKRKYGISSSECQKKLSVIIWIGYNKNQSLLKKQLEISENHKDCSQDIQTGTKPTREKLSNILQGNANYKSYIHILIMMDEMYR